MRATMKEIGSIFPIYNVNPPKTTSSAYDKNEIRFSLCREALMYIARSVEVERKVALLPAYTCQTVIDPFEQAGWECHFYGIKKDLRIDSESFVETYSSNKPIVVVFHPYYGRDLDASEKALLEFSKKQGSITVVDITQSIYLSKKNDSVDYYVGSYRKWIPIPDGGFIYSCNREIKPFPEMLGENEEFCTLQKDAMYLRGLYFRNNADTTKQISIRLNKKAEGYASNTSIKYHKMSKYSQTVLDNELYSEAQKQRKDNFAALLCGLENAKSVKCIIQSLDELESAPLYFPIYTEDRTRYQTALAANKIYAPILWPVEDERVYIIDTVRYIYDHILLLPIDQRYDRVDMQRISNTICAIERGDMQYTSKPT